MKILISAFCFISFSILSGQTTIEVTFTDKSQTSVLWYTPKEGDFSFASRVEERANANGVLRIEAEISRPGYFYLFPQLEYKKDGWHCHQIYLEPNDHLKLTIDPAKREEVTISGAHTELNQFLNNRERHFLLYISNTDHFMEMVTGDGPETIFFDLFTRSDEEINELKNIELSNDQFKYVSADIFQYYKHAFYKGLLSLGYEYPDIKPKWLDFIVNTDLLPIHDSYDFASMWVNESLALKYLTLKQNHIVNLESREEDRDSLFLSAAFDFEELKVYLANDLIMNAGHNQMDKTLLKRYSMFKEFYSDYPFFDKIADAYENQLKFLKEKETSMMSTPLVEIGSLAELVGNVKTEYIFLDVWATWCSPCIAEFSESDSLKSFINEHVEEIEIAYITLDENRTKKEINQVINYHKLSGLQFLSINNLRKELEEKIGNINSISLPAYALIDRDGKIVLRSTSRPSNWKSLKAELIEAMSL